MQNVRVTWYSQVCVCRRSSHKANKLLISRAAEGKHSQMLALEHIVQEAARVYVQNKQYSCHNIHSPVTNSMAIAKLSCTKTPHGPQPEF